MIRCSGHSQPKITHCLITLSPLQDPAVEVEYESAPLLQVPPSIVAEFVNSGFYRSETTLADRVSGPSRGRTLVVRAPESLHRWVGEFIAGSVSSSLGR